MTRTHVRARTHPPSHQPTHAHNKQVSAHERTRHATRNTPHRSAPWQRVTEPRATTPTPLARTGSNGPRATPRPRENPQSNCSAHDAARPAPSQVLIQVHTSSVNPVDWKLAEQGLYHTPSQLGADVSGVVVGVGAGCSRLQVNDEVWSDVGYSGLAPGAHGNGAWAEYVTVAEEVVSKKPNSLPHSVAGALPLVALTAYQSMVTTRDQNSSGIC